MHILSINPHYQGSWLTDVTVLNSDLVANFSQHYNINNAIDKGINVIKGELQVQALFQLEKFFQKKS